MANNLQYGLSESMNVWLQEARKTLQLAFPIMLSQVSQNLIQVIDTAMIGRVGVVPLAAAAFASNMFIVPLVFCYGISSAVSVLAANAFGAGDSKRADRVLRCGLVVSMVAGLLIALGMQMMRGMLHQLGQPEAVSIEAEPYFVLLGWSIAPVLLGSSLKNYSEANSRPWVPVHQHGAAVGSQCIFQLGFHLWPFWCSCHGIGWSRDRHAVGPVPCHPLSGDVDWMGPFLAVPLDFPGLVGAAMGRFPESFIDRVAECGAGRF